MNFKFLFFFYLKIAPDEPHFMEQIVRVDGFWMLQLLAQLQHGLVVTSVLLMPRWVLVSFCWTMLIISRLKNLYKTCRFWIDSSCCCFSLVLDRRAPCWSAHLRVLQKLQLALQQDFKMISSHTPGIPYHHCLVVLLLYIKVFLQDSSSMQKLS